MSTRPDGYFDPAGGEGRICCFAAVFVSTKAPNVDRKTSERKGTTVKDAQPEAFLVRIPTVVVPLSLPEVNRIMLIQVNARSLAWIYGCSHAGIVCSNPAGDIDVLSCGCCVLAGRGLWVGLITRPKECCRVWCVLSVHEATTL